MRQKLKERKAVIESMSDKIFQWEEHILPHCTLGTRLQLRVNPPWCPDHWLTCNSAELFALRSSGDFNTLPVSSSCHRKCVKIGDNISPGEFPCSPPCEPSHPPSVAWALLWALAPATLSLPSSLQGWIMDSFCPWLLHTTHKECELEAKIQKSPGS